MRIVQVRRLLDTNVTNVHFGAAFNQPQDVFPLKWSVMSKAGISEK